MKKNKMDMIKMAAGLSRTSIDFTSCPHGRVFDNKRQKYRDKAALKEMRAY